MNPKGFAKKVASLLRKNGVHTGVLRGNGTTCPTGHDKFEAFFVFEPKCTYDNQKIVLNFEMDKGLSVTISKIFDKYEIPYSWNGSEGRCFQLVPYDLEVEQ